MVRLLLAGAVLGASLSTAFAQTANDTMDMAYSAARNQLGVLKYCQDAGHIDGEAVDLQTKMMGMLPPVADKSKGDAAEELGKKGTVSAMGMTQDLPAAAKMQNISIAQMCKTMADAVKQASASMPKQ